MTHAWQLLQEEVFGLSPGPGLGILMVQKELTTGQRPAGWPVVQAAAPLTWFMLAFGSCWRSAGRVPRWWWPGARPLAELCWPPPSPLLALPLQTASCSMSRTYPRSCWSVRDHALARWTSTTHKDTLLWSTTNSRRYITGQKLRGRAIMYS